MSYLTFNEERHEYRAGDVVVPSVTQILKPLTDFSMVPKDVLERASQFGRAVHKACELSDLGNLEEATLDSVLYPYLAGWKKFSREHAVKWVIIERPLYSDMHKYAGTPDRFGTVDGKAAVVDIKSSTSLYPAVGPQLAAYKNLVPGSPPICRRIGVLLKPDGNYELKEYTDRDDWSLFLSLLTVRHWCKRHSITPNYQEQA